MRNLTLKQVLKLKQVKTFDLNKVINKIVELQNTAQSKEEESFIIKLLVNQCYFSKYLDFHRSYKNVY